MISKKDKQEVLARIKDKEERMKMSNIIDKANKSQASQKIEATTFLNLKEKSSAVAILNSLKIGYEVIFPTEYSEKSIIFFLPDYMKKDDIILDNYISCIKIIPKDMSKLKHKDFMGSIYNIGIKDEHIGDIFLNQKYAYVFISKSLNKFILDSLFKVSNQEVLCEDILLDSEEVKSLKIDYWEKSYIIPSKRIDALLSEVYNIGRKETKDKIVSGDLLINSKVCINPADEFKENDIISFRRCGKLRVGQELRITRSGNICINIFRYK